MAYSLNHWSEAGPPGSKILVSPLERRSVQKGIRLQWSKWKSSSERIYYFFNNNNNRWQYNTYYKSGRPAIVRYFAQTLGIDLVLLWNRKDNPFCVRSINIRGVVSGRKVSNGRINFAIDILKSIEIASVSIKSPKSTEHH